MFESLLDAINAFALGANVTVGEDPILHCVVIGDYTTMRNGTTTPSYLEQCIRERRGQRRNGVDLSVSVTYQFDYYGAKENIPIMMNEAAALALELADINTASIPLFDGTTLTSCTATINVWNKLRQDRLIGASLP